MKRHYTKSSELKEARDDGKYVNRLPKLVSSFRDIMNYFQHCVKLPVKMTSSFM